MFDQTDDGFNGDARWRLVDPRPIRDENPYTFFVPSDAEKKALKEGDNVKLIFEGLDPDTGGTERMWVIHTGRDATGWYGKLDNEPYAIAGLSCGDPILFQEYHMVSVLDVKVDDLSDEDRFFARCHVDPRILEDGAQIAWLERRKPKRNWWWQRSREQFADTGWCIYAEGGKALRRARMQHVAIGVLLNRDDSFLPFLDAPPGTRLIREGDEFRKA